MGAVSLHLSPRVRSALVAGIVVWVALCIVLLLLASVGPSAGATGALIAEAEKWPFRWV